jgi:hypothetical protein
MRQVANGPQVMLERRSPLPHLLWRWRSQLAPVYAGFGLLVGAAVGHVIAPRSWWEVLPAGAAAVAVVIGPPSSWWEHVSDRLVDLRWGPDSEAERLHMGSIGGLSTLWVTAVWYDGPGMVLTGALLGGILAVSSPKLWSRRLRASRKARRLRREWRKEYAAGANLPGSRIQSIAPTEHGWTVRLRLRPGQTVDDVRRNIGRIASVLAVRPGGHRVIPDPTNARRCTLEIVERHAEPAWSVMGQPVERVGADRVHVELLDEPDAIGASPKGAQLGPFGDSTWRPRLVGPGEVVVMPRRIGAPSDPLLDALRDAPEGGWTMAELVTESGRGKSTVYDRVRRMVGDGTAVEVSRGRFRAAGVASSEAFR